jgi:hypothetical protein
MNKRKLMIALAILTIAIGAYFLLFVGKDTPAGTDNNPSVLSSDSLDQLDTEILREREAQLREASMPEDFLQISIDPKKNLLGESVIEGTIENRASTTTYKDFELMIYWQDEVGAVMDSAAEVVFERLEAGEKLDFKTKRKGPRKSKAIQVKLRGAKVGG